MERRRESSGLPREGCRLWSPLPRRVREEERESRAEGGREPAWGADPEAHSIIKEEVVLFPPPKCAAIPPRRPRFLSSVPLTQDVY